ncbi:MAG: Re/Si-specific NAD(P)(+) transhydrogenase subunit alpha [Pseudomonadota bacterium]
MTLSVSILKEVAPHEARVAATPKTIKKMCDMGLRVTVQKDAGLAASYTDEAYVAAGATIAATAAAAVKDADFIMVVQATPDTAKLAGKGCIYIGLLSPYNRPDVLAVLAQAGATAMALEFVPRTTRAQSMDVLSSQANLAGYRAVLEATAHYTRGMPMMMTAAGTIAPARVFIMGAGVAGLQAIATARRLGAVVAATDVRLAAKEQVQSLGGTFVMVEDDETKQSETSGGYAREMSDAYRAKQTALIAETITKQDIVITTALIPGRPAPTLITAEMVKSMKPGSVIIDMAIEQGGNCALSKPDTIVTINGVKIIAPANLPSLVATDAAALYAQNIVTLMGLLVKNGEHVAGAADDDIVAAITLVKGGQIVHPSFAGVTVPKPSTAKPSVKGKKK